MDIFYQNYKTIFIREILKQNKNLDNLLNFVFEMRFSERYLNDKLNVISIS